MAGDRTPPQEAVSRLPQPGRPAGAAVTGGGQWGEVPTGPTRVRARVLQKDRPSPLRYLPALDSEPPACPRAVRLLVGKGSRTQGRGSEGQRLGGCFWSFGGRCAKGAASQPACGCATTCATRSWHRPRRRCGWDWPRIAVAWSQSRGGCPLRGNTRSRDPRAPGTDHEAGMCTQPRENQTSHDAGTQGRRDTMGAARLPGEGTRSLARWRGALS